MASFYNNKISTTYVSIIKSLDNAALTASLKELSDGSGNATGLFMNTGGDFKVTNILEWGTLKDTGENISITKFVDEADGIANNDNDTSIPTTAAIVDYVAARITLEDLDFSGTTGTGSVDLDSQVFAIVGTTNEIETSAGSQQLQIGLPDNVTIGGNLQVNGLLKGNNNIVIKDTSDRTMAAFYGGNKTELYFNDSKKFETTGDGATVTGGLTATGGSVFTGATFSSNVTITGVLSVTGDGSNAATFTESGSGDFDIVSVDDLRLTSGGNDIVLKGASSSEFGRLSNDSQNFVIKNITTDKEIQFHAEAGGSTVEYLSIGGANEFIEFLKDARFGDSVKARFGASDDLQIYHDGSNSYIDDTGTGDLKIRGETNVYIAAATGGANMAQFTKGGAVKLRYNDSNKFETTNTGIQVTDEVSIGTSLVHTGDTDTKVSFGTDEIVLTTAGADAVKVDSSGDVGIGEPSIDARLHISSIAGGGISNIKLESSGASKWAFGIPAGQTYLAFDETSDDLSTPTMVLTKTTKLVGIGTTAPSELLELKPAAGADSKINILKSDGTQKALVGYDNGNGGLINLYNEAGTKNVVVRGYGDSYFKGGNFGIGTDAPTAALQVVGLVEYADNAAALAAGLTAGAFYRTGDLLKVVH